MRPWVAGGPAHLDEVDVPPLGEPDFVPDPVSDAVAVPPLDPPLPLFVVLVVVAGDPLLAAWPEGELPDVGELLDEVPVWVPLGESLLLDDALDPVPVEVVPGVTDVDVPLSAPVA